MYVIVPAVDLVFVCGSVQPDWVSVTQGNQIRTFVRLEPRNMGECGPPTSANYRYSRLAALHLTPLFRTQEAIPNYVRFAYGLRLSALWTRDLAGMTLAICG